jgi:hypothetical protein
MSLFQEMRHKILSHEQNLLLLPSPGNNEKLPAGAYHQFRSNGDDSLLPFGQLRTHHQWIPEYEQRAEDFAGRQYLSVL